MAELSFISDELFKRYAEEVLLKLDAAESEAEANLYKNVIDPFSAVFDAIKHDFDIEQWLAKEKSRQVQKTMQNAVGEFHQNVVGAIGDWENAGRGGEIDVKNTRLKIIAEIKNKHNTMNSGTAESVYNKLASRLRYAEKGFVGYVVMIVPSNIKPFDKPWSHNLKLTNGLRDDIRKIDGKSFYKMVTGDDRALEKIYDRLPYIIGQVVGASPESLGKSEAFRQLFDRAYGK